ncbi:2-aminoethylphosphonate--pyruvate transaminase [soil metagenome]
MTQLLLTPGPLTTAHATRQAMTRDWGSRDPAFIALTAELRERLLAAAHGEATHVSVPLQGSGTFIVEAALGTVLKPADRLLVLVNGAYGERMLKICERIGRSATAMRWDEDQPVDPAALQEHLLGAPQITHVAVVHCETTTGIRNPLEAVAAVCAEAGKALIVDAMSSFGVLPLDLRTLTAQAVLASSNKGLEGAPGLGFALIDRPALEAAKGNAPSLSLDLHEQWRGFETNGQWRFTPPVQVVAALLDALRAFAAEGGQAGRGARYAENLRVLVEGMAALGYDRFLDPAVQAPVSATFRQPAGWGVSFDQFYDRLAQAGLLIYHGELTPADTFRIGCIGQVHPDDMRRLVETVGVITPARAARSAA